MNEEGKTNMEESLEKIFNLEEGQPIAEAIRDEHGIDLVANSSTEVVEGEYVEGEYVEGDSQVDSDLDYARRNIRDLIESSSEVVETLSRLAKQSESPRMFEVLSTLISSLVNANRELVDTHKKGRQIKNLGSEGSRKQDPAGPRTVNNTVFVGSTQQLQEQFQKRLQSNTG